MSNFVYIIILLEVYSFFLRAVAADRAYVYHAITELNTGAPKVMLLEREGHLPFDGNVEISDVVQAEVDQLL